MQIKHTLKNLARWSGVPVDHNDRKLVGLRENRTSDRCFVIGNGPSLTPEDLDVISEKDSMACNRIYLIYPKTVWRPNYYLAVDEKVIKSIKSELSFDDRTTVLSTFDCAKHLPLHAEVIKFRENFINKRIVGAKSDTEMLANFHFSKNALFNVSAGWNSLFTGIQLAYWIGYREVILLGVDHSYPRNVTNDKSCYKPENMSKSHFTDNYMADLNQIDEPNVRYTTSAFHKARLVFEQKGRRLLNASRKSALDCIPRVSLEDYI